MQQRQTAAATQRIKRPPSTIGGNIEIISEGFSYFQLKDSANCCQPPPPSPLWSPPSLRASFSPFSCNNFAILQFINPSLAPFCSRQRWSYLLLRSQCSFFQDPLNSVRLLRKINGENVEDMDGSPADVVVHCICIFFYITVPPFNAIDYALPEQFLKHLRKEYDSNVQIEDGKKV